jgi:predicted Zn-dependent peptidase
MAGAPAVGPLPPLRVPRLSQFHLGNGLEVVAIPRTVAPIVSLTLTLRSGADAEPAAMAGLASLTAEMMDEGAGDRSALDIARDLEQIGADLWLGAGRDGSQLGLQVPRAGFERALQIASDILLRPRFAADDWERVKSDRLTGLAQRRDQPESVSNVVADRVLFAGDHPYGQPVEGFEGTVGRIALPDVSRFHAARWRSSDASLIVAGDVDERALPEQLERAFGRWAGGDVPAIRAGGRPATPPRLVLVHRPGAPQSVVRVIAPGETRLSTERTALRMLNAIFGGTFTSRLNFNLREQKGYTYGANSSFSFMRQAGSFTARAAVFTEVTAASVTEFLNELRELRQRPIIDDELTKARATLLDRAAEALSTTGGLTSLYGELRLYGLGLDEPARFVRELEEPTAVSLQELARRHIDPDQVGFVIVGDRVAIEPELLALGLPPPRLYDADGNPTS